MIVPQELVSEYGLMRMIWVVWKYEQRDGKPTKVLYNPRRPKCRAKSDTPETWGSYLQASSCVESGAFSGLGFVIPPGLVFVDFDKVLDDQGNAPDWVEGIVKRLGSYTEVSPSGRGLHVLCSGALPGKRCRFGKALEMYDGEKTHRFATFSGKVWGPSRPIRSSAFLAKLYEGTCPASYVAASDVDLSGVKWEIDKDLYPEVINAEESIRAAIARNPETSLARLFMSGTREGDDDSREDWSFCGQIAWHCNYCPDVMYGVVKRSMMMRPKWERDGYREDTIGGILSKSRSLQAQLAQRYPRLGE